MIVLAIETATLVSSVALMTENKLLAELTLQTGKTHSEKLMPSINQLLQLSGLKIEQIQAVAVSIGPGSFTGLRIGLATAKALAYVGQIPIVGVPTLEALAYQVPESNSYLVSLADAQKRRLYTAIYKWQEQNLITVKEAAVLSIAELQEQLLAIGQPALLLGEGADLLGTEICGSVPLCQVAPVHLRMPRAAAVAKAAWHRLKTIGTDDLMQLAPLYLRRSEAEILWDKRQDQAQ